MFHTHCNALRLLANITCLHDAPLEYDQANEEEHVECCTDEGEDDGSSVQTRVVLGELLEGFIYGHRAANTADVQPERSVWGNGCRVPQAAGSNDCAANVPNAARVQCIMWSNRHLTGRAAQRSRTVGNAYSESAGTG